MRVNRFSYYCVLVLSLFMATPSFAQGPAKAGAKSITVYKTPT